MITLSWCKVPWPFQQTTKTVLCFGLIYLILTICLLGSSPNHYLALSSLRQNQMSQRGLLESSSASAAGGAGGRRREVPVPFRDSKLTRLLQSFFLGQGVAAMIVNISQAPALFDETLQVLKFSAIAKKVGVYNLSSWESL